MIDDRDDCSIDSEDLCNVLANAGAFDEGAPMHSAPTPSCETTESQATVVAKENLETLQTQSSMMTVMTPGKLWLNPLTQVDADWSQSWNPALGKPKTFIDINCLAGREMMQYFKGKDSTEKFNELIRFVWERCPHDLIWGAIFYVQSQAFEYKIYPYENDFVRLQTLSPEYHETFRRTLFVSREALKSLFERLRLFEVLGGGGSERNGFWCVRCSRESKIQMGRQPSMTNGKWHLNPFKLVVANWNQSWNPARRSETRFIDIECLTRVENVMKHFCYQGEDTPQCLDMDWLVEFIADRYPYAMISGEIFHCQSQHFMCTKSSGNTKFIALTALSSQDLNSFRKSLFISFDTLSRLLFKGPPISQLFSNVAQNASHGETKPLFRIRRQTEGHLSETPRGAQSNSSSSDDNGGGDGSNDGDSDNYNGQGQPGRPQQQRGANGGSDRPPSKRSRGGENDGAEGSSSEGDSDEEEEEEHDFGDLSPLNASEADVNVTDISGMSVLSDLAADHSVSSESVDSSAVIDSETKDTAEAAATESSEDVKDAEQAKSPASEAAEGAIPEASVNNQPKPSSLSVADSVRAAKTIDDRKATASAPPPTTFTLPARWNDTASVAGTEVCAAAAADTRTLIDEAETVNWNDAKTQRDDDSDVDDDDDAEVDIGKKRASSSVVKYNRREKTPHVANVGLGALTARTLTDLVTAMDNPLMWDCPYVQLKDVLKKVLTRLNKDKDKKGVNCDVDVVRVLLDMVENNHLSLDLSSPSMKLLGSLKAVTGAVLLDAASKGQIAMDVQGKAVDSDAVYVPRGCNPLYLPLVMAVFGCDDISHIKMLETMMTGKRTDRIKILPLSLTTW